MLRVSRLCQWQCEWWSLIPRELWNLSKGPLRTSFWGSKMILTDKEDTAFPEAAGTSRVHGRMDTSRRTPWESKGAFFGIASPQVFSACLLKMNLDVIKYHVILTDHLFFFGSSHAESFFQEKSLAENCLSREAMSDVFWSMFLVLR